MESTVSKKLMLKATIIEVFQKYNQFWENLLFLSRTIKWAGRNFKQILKKWAGPIKDEQAGKLAKKLGASMLV